MTKSMSRFGYLMGVAVLLSGFALPPQADGRAVAPEGRQATTDAFTEELIADLAASGFQVSQGYPALYTQQDCYDRTYPILKNCFGANPAAPYVLPVVKSWPEEYVDPALVNAFVETDPGYSVTYRLDQREALVIYGQMPPPGRNMGLQTFEFSEHGQWRPKDYDQWANTPDLPFPMQYLFSTIPPDDPESHRIITLSSLGDVVNNVVMERQSGYPFGEIRYFIVTPSAATDTAVRLALQAQGVPDSHIFTEQIPRQDEFGPIGPLGLGKNAIDFFTAFRYAVPDDLDVAETWRANPPLTVLRMRAPDSLGPVQRYGSLVFAPRTANSEAYLAGDLQNLVDAVCDSVSSYANLTSTDCVQPPPASSFIWDLVRDFGWTGPYCRDIGMDCLGDQQEAAYFFSTPRPTGAGEVYAVVATLATETDNAIYVGLSANDASIMGGVPNGTLLDTQLKGSADVYAFTVDSTGKFFVRYFTDDCAVLANVPGGLANCTEISGMSTQGDPALQGMIIISLRDYIAPGTTSGPNASELLTPRILTFTHP
ncbi:MAG: hypothetical protein VR65_00985 [Desulfobulbaceae bacterium BRH_c16a]|nr:MAG: hypothetical protein VR65_00985 [Desulfobulbaceae bacterium BRH_c16a]